jgi:transposase-like protein
MSRKPSALPSASPGVAGGQGPAGPVGAPATRHDGRTRPPDPLEFRAEAVRLARSRVAPLVQIARDLGISQDTLREWVRRAAIEAGDRAGATSEEQAELHALRRRVRELEEEREMLKKATAFFVREGATR